MTDNAFVAWAMIALSLFFAVYSLDQFVGSFRLLWLAESVRRDESERAVRPRL